MSQTQQSTVRNRLLKAMSPDDFALLGPHLQPLHAELRQTLIYPHEPVTHLVFPDSGYVSVVAENSGGRIEVGMIGPEGLVGASAVLLGAGTAPYHEFVQCPGEMLAIEAMAFCAAVDHSYALRKLMMRYVQTKLIQARQTVFANDDYTMDVCLARVMLMTHVSTEVYEYNVSHEFI